VHELGRKKLSKIPPRKNLYNEEVEPMVQEDAVTEEHKGVRETENQQVLAEGISKGPDDFTVPWFAATTSAGDEEAHDSEQRRDCLLVLYDDIPGDICFLSSSLV
jgi:hypothetical protein